ncbi:MULTISPECIES: metalloregulator ArsR/SmtB family transcription factor [Allobacillus]|uniref:Winged helix-turn-helix transcriptional regulator n=1 Tax=Allobacillus salarius TaxID=1955272 RepID=A0A556PDF2_9BACI|nr:metalloregulator ArsR/SmtB family transcription factor [Allobacillus salarius]TSJ62394.1 winged helix-turn-helix transcriptional regulator [Allobacillus salarius]
MTQKDTCEVFCYNEEKVEQVQQDLEEVDIKGTAMLLKAIADEKRAKIVYALCQEEELCVCDLANIIGATVATTSHHLRTLYKQGVVRYRKEHKLAFYSLDDDHIKQIMLVAIEHQKEVMVSG